MRNNMIELATRAHTLDSREVAKMVDKKHAHLCRDISGYIEAMHQNPKLDSDTFFIERSYIAGTGKQYKRYDITKQGCELKPKADYTDRILNSKSLVSITQIAKDYGMSGKAMNRKLHELGIIYKLGGQWLLYSRYQAKVYTHSETVDITHSDGRADVVMNTKWTQKGRLFLYQKLKKHGILPVIEQDQRPVLTIVE